MGAKITLKRGLKKDLPTLNDGELGYCKDTKELYIGNEGVNETVGGNSSNINADKITLKSAGGGLFELTINDDGTLNIKKKIEGSDGGSFIINQFYGGGTNNDGPVSHSFIELYNGTDEDIDMTKYSVHYCSFGGDWTKINTTGTIKSKHSYLIRGAKCRDGATLEINNFDMEDATCALPNKGVKVLLVNHRLPIFDTPNPFNPMIEGYVDMIGIAGNDVGLTIDGYEGEYIFNTGSGEGQSKQKSVRRIGFKDTNNNREDVETVDWRLYGDTTNGIYNKIPRWGGYGAWDVDDWVENPFPPQDEWNESNFTDAELKGLVINQVYGGGNLDDGATSVSHGFVELYNKNDYDIDLNNICLHYSPVGVNWSKLNLSGHSIKAKSSFLIRCNRHNTEGSAVCYLPINNYDVEWDATITNKGVKFVLAACDKDLAPSTNPFADQVERYIDMVGASDTLANSDGYEVSPVLGQSKQKAVRRVNFQDTNNNSLDFEIVDYRNHGNDSSTSEGKQPRYSGDGAWGEETESVEIFCQSIGLSDEGDYELHFLSSKSSVGIEYRMGDEEGEAFVAQTLEPIIEDGANKFKFAFPSGGTINYKLNGATTPKTIVKPDTAQLKIVQFTDTQAETPYSIGRWRECVEKAKDFAPDIIVHTGDHVDNGLRTTEWIDYFNGGKELYENVPVLPVYGNNDVSSSCQTMKKYFGKSKNYYSVDVGNIHFVTLDSNGDRDEQLAWLETDLVATSKKWKIVLIHNSPKLVETSIISEAFVPAFVQYGVDLVLSGHKHMYIKSKAIDGVRYVMSGSSGDKTAGSQSNNGNWENSYVFGDLAGYIRYTVNESSLVVDCRKISEGEDISVDTFTLTK